MFCIIELGNFIPHTVVNLVQYKMMVLHVTEGGQGLEQVSNFFICDMCDMFIMADIKFLCSRH